MKNRFRVLSLCSVLTLAIAGCGGVEEETQPPPANAPAGENQPQVEPGAQEEAPTDGEVQAQGKRCNASCSVVSVGASSCPTFIGGTGNTTFLGGCDKACRKAEGDAASKLPPGCAIHTCDFSGC